MANNVPYHQRVADEIIKQLKEGTAPWLKPWQPGTQPSRPMNALTGKAYRGWNSVYLAMAQPNSDPRWCTFKQAKALGAHIKKGSKSIEIQYWKTKNETLIRDEKGKPVLDKEGEKQYRRTRLANPMPIKSNVFHASQIEGLPPLAIQPEKPQWQRHEQAEEILKKSGAMINHDQADKAFYRPSTDSIHLPDRTQFETPDNYYATALHELGHWTGHESRLNRDMQNRFGTESYAKEELRAELTSFMLGAELEIGHDPGQHVAYVESWIKALQDDPKEIFRASRDAEKIKDYVLSLGKEQQQTFEQQSQSPNTKATKETISNQQPAPEKTWLQVPFNEKNQAKAKGAKWDKEAKSWYAPQGTDLSHLKEWLPENKAQTTHLEDPVIEFGQALKDAGLIINGLPIMDGKMHRVPVEGGKKGHQDGAYKGFLDGHPAGFIQNFKTGYKGNWKASGQRINPQHIEKLKTEAKAKQQARAREEEKQYENKSVELTKLFNQLPLAPNNHPYLEKKCLKNNFGLRQDDRNNLVIPLQDSEGKIWSLQRIGKQGFKQFEKNAKSHGCYHVLGGIEALKQEKKDTPLLISTGLATSASIKEATQQCVVVSFQDGNLKTVAESLKKQYPDRKVVILGDDDRHNTEKGLPNSGREKAEEAAKAAGGIAIFPQFTKEETGKEHTDFSDLQRVAGKAAIKRQIQKGLSNQKSTVQNKDNPHADIMLKEKIMRKSDKKKERSRSLEIA